MSTNDRDKLKRQLNSFGELLAAPDRNEVSDAIRRLVFFELSSQINRRFRPKPNDESLERAHMELLVGHCIHVEVACDPPAPEGSFSVTKEAAGNVEKAITKLLKRFCPRRLKAQEEHPEDWGGIMEALRCDFAAVFGTPLLQIEEEHSVNFWIEHGAALKAGRDKKLWRMSDSELVETTIALNWFQNRYCFMTLANVTRAVNAKLGTALSQTHIKDRMKNLGLWRNRNPGRVPKC